MLYITVVLTFISTILGGLFALKNQDKLHRILGFTAGVLLGVVAFDLLPEIFDLVNKSSYTATVPMVALVSSFLVFHIVEKSVIIHHAHEQEYGAHKHPQIGTLSAFALIGHSFLDGVGIGLGFQLSNTIGITVALAVIAHDFADGLNTVTLMLTHKNTNVKARRMLYADAIAPVLGALLASRLHIGTLGLLIYLGIFCGFLLYIGASDILPEAHAKHPSRLTLALTVLGTVFIFIVTRLI